MIICGVLELENLAFQYVPQIPAYGDLSPFINFFLSWMTIVLNTIDAIVIFSFNSMVRSKLKEIFQFKKPNNVVPKDFTGSNATQMVTRKTTVAVVSVSSAVRT